MADRVVKIGDGFWNIRGSFKHANIIEIGTQASLVQLNSGGFVLLDSYTFEGEVASEIMALTDGGKAVEAILNLHPFHTIHVKAMAAMFPNAKLYGTARHVEKAPDLAWEPLHTDDPEMHALFRDDFDFSVPRGVDFISTNEKLHFSSVLAFHKGSKTLHVDDTLTYTKLPFVGGLSFHMTLKGVLQPRPDAAADFRAWATELVARCEQVEHLCTAHARPLPPRSLTTTALADSVAQALAKVEKILLGHERKHAQEG